MIDPRDDLPVQVAKQAKIIAALIERSNHRHEFGDSAYSLFQSAIMLQGKVSQKTRDLEDALTTLGRASNRLETSEEARAQTQRTLTDALETMEGGFALFAEGRLQVFNDFFRVLIPDIEHLVVPGLDFSGYLEAVTASNAIRPSASAGQLNLGRSLSPFEGDPAAPFVFGLASDRWFVISCRRTSSDNIVVLQTEITAILRNNRIEKNRLINDQETFLQAAFDHMPQGVGTFSADGTMLISNARFGDLLTLPIQLTPLGTSFGQIIEFLKAQALLDTFPHENFDSLMRFLRRAGNLRFRVRHVSGRVLDVDVNPMPNGGCIVNVMDVTVGAQTTRMLEEHVQERTLELTRANEKLRAQHSAQARVEEDLRLAKAEVEAAMTSKTRFFAAASHDLLQPINAAKLMISTLMDQAPGTMMDETVTRLDGSFRSIEGLLHALLDIARLEAVDTHLQVTPLPLSDVLRGVVGDMGQLATQKGIDLRVVASSLWVESDPRYLSRCVQNFVDNAIRYTYQGRILVGCRRQGDHVIIEVWDTGIGISKKDQSRIFTEFIRVGPGTGMGLGLSIVDRACRHLGHEVALRSWPGQGSVFSIKLPVVAPLYEAGQIETSGVISAADMDLIVLLVENDAGVSYAMTRKLEGWGASVLAAQSTAEALELVEDIGMAPDIILADYHLNDDEIGTDAITTLRARFGAGIPAIMITANDDDAIKETGVHHGFSVLTKPVQLSRLRSLIDWQTRRATGTEQRRPKSAMTPADKQIG